MTDTDTPPKQVKPDNYRPEEMNTAIEHALVGKCDRHCDRFQAHRYEDGSVRASVTVIVSAEQYAAWLESEACREWRETTIAGLRSELAKTREKLRRAEAKKTKDTEGASV